MLGSLKVRNYRLFATGQVISLIGTWMQFIAQDWLVLQLTDNSGTALGVVTALQFTPFLLLTLYGGKLADRYDKRKLLLAANAVWAVLAGVLGVLVVAGVARPWHVMVFALALGTVNAVEIPVRQSFVSELVGRDLLPNALALNGAVFNVARIIGPAVAGVCISLFGTGPVFLLNTLTYAAPMVGLLLMRTADLHRSAERPARADTRIRDGLLYVRQRPDLLLPIVLIGFVAMVGFNFQLTLAIMAKTVFVRGAASFGLLSTALAAGALVAALASSRRTRRPSAYVVIGAAMGFGVFTTLVGLAPSYWTVAALLVPTGFASIYLAQAANQRLQLGVDPAYRGRVMALYTLVFMGTNPLGAPVIGWFAQHFGARPAIWVGGVLSFLAASAVLLVRNHRRGVTMRVHARPLPHLHLYGPEEDELRWPAPRADLAPATRHAA